MAVHVAVNQLRETKRQKQNLFLVTKKRESITFASAKQRRWLQHERRWQRQKQNEHMHCMNAKKCWYAYAEHRMSHLQRDQWRASQLMTFDTFCWRENDHQCVKQQMELEEMKPPCTVKLWMKSQGQSDLKNVGSGRQPFYKTRFFLRIRALNASNSSCTTH